MTDFASPPIDAAAVARSYDRAELLLRRWGGTVIDLLALAIIAVVLVAATAQSRTAEGVAILVVLVLLLGYYPVTEGVWGRTLGKLVTGTIVVDKDGHRPNIGQVLVRTLLRLLEVNPFFLGGIPAGVAVMATESKQRLGDLAANTYVLPTKALQAAAATSTGGASYTHVIVD